MKKKKQKADWEGYTLEELTYRRALVLARIELTKDRMSENISRIKKGNVLLSGASFGRILKMINYTDFIVLGISLWRKFKPLFKRNR